MLYEVTPITEGDYVIVIGSGLHGTISEVTTNGYVIRKNVHVKKHEVAVYRFDYFPIFEVMWTFKCKRDKEWIATGDGLYALANCGFRIYKQEDLGYVFGADSIEPNKWLKLYNVKRRNND